MHFWQVTEQVLVKVLATAAHKIYKYWAFINRSPKTSIAILKIVHNDEQNLVFIQIAIYH